MTTGRVVTVVLLSAVLVWFGLALREQSRAEAQANAETERHGRLRIVSDQRGAGYYCQDYVVHDDVAHVTCYTARCDKGVAISCLPDPSGALSR